MIPCNNQEKKIFSKKKNKITMKKLFTSTIAIILMFSLTSWGQGWEQLTTGLESEDDPWILYDMHFPEGQNDVGYAVSSLFTTGQQGKLIKTEDGGNTWDVIWPVTGTIKGLTVVWFFTPDVGFVGGYQQTTGTNYLIKTEDGGATWTEIDLGVDVWYFQAIEFWDDNNGVLAGFGDQLFVTDDGGATWTAATGITTGVQDISYATADLLFLVGGDEVMCKSEDGGLTWSEFYSGTFQRYFFGVDFANEDFGVVGGEDGKILTTTNGGTSWSEFATGWHNFYPIVAFEADSAYVGGTDADIYKTLDAGANWELDMEEDGSSLYRIQFTANKTGFTCGAWGKMWRKEAPLTAGFSASETTVCAGSSIDFTDLSTGTPTSWDWTFEGGDPATSTDQNPTVTYNNTGTFNVELTVSDAASNSETKLEVDYIAVIETPGQADMPAGDDMICTDGNYTYTTPAVDFAESYMWELLPAEAGTCTWNDNEATVETTEDWTGDFTLKVKAVNMCGDGLWSDEFAGSIYLTPDVFVVEGGGSYCVGGDGVEITLSGSQEGVDYELYFEGDPSGNIVAGTGSKRRRSSQIQVVL